MLVATVPEQEHGQTADACSNWRRRWKSFPFNHTCVSQITTSWFIALDVSAEPSEISHTLPASHTCTYGTILKAGLIGEHSHPACVQPLAWSRGDVDLCCLGEDWNWGRNGRNCDSGKSVLVVLACSNECVGCYPCGTESCFLGLCFFGHQSGLCDLLTFSPPGAVGMCGGTAQQQSLYFVPWTQRPNNRAEMALSSKMNLSWLSFSD